MLSNMKERKACHGLESFAVRLACRIHFGYFQNLQKQLRDIEAAKAALDTSLLQCQGDVTSLRAELQNSRREKEDSEQLFKQQVLDRGLQLLGKSAMPGLLAELTRRINACSLYKVYKVHVISL